MWETFNSIISLIRYSTANSFNVTLHLLSVKLLTCNNNIAHLASSTTTVQSRNALYFNRTTVRLGRIHVYVCFIWLMNRSCPYLWIYIKKQVGNLQSLPTTLLIVLTVLIALLLEQTLVSFTIYRVFQRKRTRIFLKTLRIAQTILNTKLRKPLCSTSLNRLNGCDMELICFPCSSSIFNKTSSPLWLKHPA